MIIDGDGHFFETEEIFEKYMEPALRNYRPRLLVDDQGHNFWVVDGQTPYKRPSIKGAGAPGTAAPPGQALQSARRATPGSQTLTNLKERLDDLDRESIDVQFIYPSFLLHVNAWPDGILAMGVCRAYNTWLADYCSYDSKRLHGVCLIPLQDPARAVEELRYAKEKLGLVGIFWRPNKLCGRTLSSPDYFPIYEAAADLGVAICVHEGARTVLEQAGADRYSEFGRHIACHPLEQMLASLNFCADGVLEKFPKLKVAYLESGCGWVPFWLERMDEHWEHEGHGQAKTTKEKPSYYFKRQCWASCEAGEELAPVFIEHVGADYLTIATDYPHSDCIGKFPDRTVGDLTKNARISPEARQKILWDNPLRLYGLEV